MAGGKEENFELTYEVAVKEGDADPGLVVNTGLSVEAVSPDSPFLRMVQVGDVVTLVNQKQPTSYYDFLRRMAKARAKGKLRLTVRRGGSMKISAEVQQMFKQRAGFTYLNVRMDWANQKERDIGLRLSNRKNRIIVVEVKEGSLADGKLAVLDRIMAVNSRFVSDIHLAKSCIRLSGGKFELLVERPLSEAARLEFGGEKVQIPANLLSVTGPIILPGDALLIATGERIRRQDRALIAPPPKGILRRPGAKTDSPTPLRTAPTPADASQTGSSPVAVVISPSYDVTLICADTDPAKSLRHIPPHGSRRDP